MTKDFFANKAGSYEQDTCRLDNVANIADAISRAVRLEKTMHIMDFGSGTGLLLERVSPYVGKITAVDISSAMNSQLRAKTEKLGCAVDILEIDLEKEGLDGCKSTMDTPNDCTSASAARTRA